MASVWDSIKSGAMSAKTSAKRGATRAKLTGEIELIKRKIRTAKRDFGEKVFEMMTNNDEAGTAALFQDYRGKVDALQRDLESKKLQIETLHPDGSYKVNQQGSVPVAQEMGGDGDGMTI